MAAKSEMIPEKSPSAFADTIGRQKKLVEVRISQIAHGNNP